MKARSVEGMLVLVVLMLGPATSFAGDDREDKTLAPYFLVLSDDPTLDQMPLKSVAAEVDIAGVIADVRITQTYQNHGTRPLEAIYVFPASTRAAVYGMEMRIGDRTITAVVRKREEAREEYEEAKEEGKSASLLEQQRANVFQMSVANNMPGDTIEVELRYTELLVPTVRLYEFVYPTVVGPRYSEKTEATATSHDGYLGTPYQHEGEAPAYSFDIGVDLATGLPIQELLCPSHSVQIEGMGTPAARVLLDPAEADGGNRDFILQYRLAGDQIASGLLLYQGSEESFFLLMAQPPERVVLDRIPPREFIFIMDVSGSMSGFPISVSKALLRDLVGHLRRTDLFNLMYFASGSALMSDSSLPATPDNIENAFRLIETRQGGGGTRILPALQRALNLPRPQEGLSRTVVIASDGMVAVEVETFELIRQHLNRMNVFAFGIGKSVNRYIIEGMARVGMGEPFVVTDEADAETQAAQFEQYISTPVLTQLELAAEGFDIHDVEPPSLPDIMAERPVIVFGKWLGTPAGTLTVSGVSGEQHFESVTDVGAVEPQTTNAALRYLWARHRIAQLGDYNAVAPSGEREEEITRLGLEYNLLTQYTSFVAIDEVVRNDSTLTTVRQPLPMPAGVSDDAIGGMAASAIEERSETLSWLGHEFREENGVWVDLAFDPTMPLVRVASLHTVPQEIAAFAELGRHLVVAVDGTAYELGSGLPIHIHLAQNVPNPFNAGTVISFRVDASQATAPVEMVVYNLAGQFVRRLVAGHLPAGEHRVAWDGRDESEQDVGSGVYVYRLSIGEATASRRMLLLR